MSLHYEWTLSLRFRMDVPEAFLEELRADFGIGPGAAPDGGPGLPGGPVASLCSRAGEVQLLVRAGLSVPRAVRRGGARFPELREVAAHGPGAGGPALFLLSA